MEGDPVSSGKTIRQSISIHSLRMEGDEMSTVSEYVGEVFQSTPSAWRETIMYFVSKMEKLISIHSLRMEGDHIFESVLCEISNFNPLPPHGGRPYGSRVIQCPLNFNPSAWRETQNHLRHEYTSCISIHSLRMEGDGSKLTVSTP